MTRRPRSVLIRTLQLATPLSRRHGHEDRSRSAGPASPGLQPHLTDRSGIARPGHTNGTQPLSQDRRVRPSPARRRHCGNCSWHITALRSGRQAPRSLRWGSCSTGTGLGGCHELPVGPTVDAKVPGHRTAGQSFHPVLSTLLEGAPAAGGRLGRTRPREGVHPDPSGGRRTSGSTPPRCLVLPLCRMVVTNLQAAGGV